MEKVMWVVEFLFISGVIAAFVMYFIFKRRLKKQKDN